VDLAAANAVPNTLAVLLGNGSGGFGPSASFAVGGNPRSVALADVNGDQKLDVVTANHSSRDVSLLLGDGSGGMGPANTVKFVPPLLPASILAGDLNGDGLPDLAVANDAVPDNVLVVLGDGRGGFGRSTAFPVGSQPAEVAAADLNGDGRLDLVTPDYGAGNGYNIPGELSVLLNTTKPPPTLSAAPYKGPQGAVVTIVGGDFGASEPVTIKWDCGTVSCSSTTVLGTPTSDGSGAFSVPVTIPNDAPAASYKIGARDSDGRFATTKFTVSATLALSPKAGSAGSSTTVSGTGFKPGENVQLRWSCASVGCSGALLATAVANTGGDFSIPVTIPAAAPGAYSIGAVGTTSSIFAKATFKIVT
jgi:hypothetical protein